MARVPAAAQPAIAAVVVAVAGHAVLPFRPAACRLPSAPTSGTSGSSRSPAAAHGPSSPTSWPRCDSRGSPRLAARPMAELRVRIPDLRHVDRQHPHGIRPRLVSSRRRGTARRAGGPLDELPRQRALHDRRGRGRDRRLDRRHRRRHRLGRVVGDVVADPSPDVPRASAPHPATPAKATTATTAGAHRRMLVGSTGGTSAAPLRFVCDDPRVQGEPAVGGALMVPTRLRADLAGIGACSQALRVPGPFRPQRSAPLEGRRPVRSWRPVGWPAAPAAGRTSPAGA